MIYLYHGTESEQDSKGLFTGMNFNSTQNLGATVDERNEKLTALLDGVAKMKLGDFKDNTIDAFGDAYEYLMKMYASITGHDPLGREKLRWFPLQMSYCFSFFVRPAMRNASRTGPAS